MKLNTSAVTPAADAREAAQQIAPSEAVNNFSCRTGTGVPTAPGAAR